MGNAITGFFSSVGNTAKDAAKLTNDERNILIGNALRTLAMSAYVVWKFTKMTSGRYSEFVYRNEDDAEDNIAMGVMERTKVIMKALWPLSLDLAGNVASFLTSVVPGGEGVIRSSKPGTTAKADSKTAYETRQAMVKSFSYIHCPLVSRFDWHIKDRKKGFPIIISSILHIGTIALEGTILLFVLREKIEDPFRMALAMGVLSLVQLFHTWWLITAH